MGLDAQQVRVAGAGHVFVAPEGTAIPDNLDPLPASWVDLGYVTTDGVTFTFSRETEDLDAWQGDKIRVLTTREPATVAFSLMQTNADVMVVAMGGGEITEIETGVFKYTPAKGDNLVRSIIVEFSDEGKHYRYAVPRAQIEGDVTFTLTRAGSVNYPLTFGLLDADPKYTIVSDDAAMGGGALPGTIGGGEGGGATASVGASAPTGTAPLNSVYIQTSDGGIFLSDGAAWEDTGFTFPGTPTAASIGPTDPTTGGGVAGADGDAYFQDEGATYAVWEKDVGGTATDWTDTTVVVTKN